MPPKPAGKKGDNEDYSDASSLPQAHIFKFTIVQKSFFDSQSRDKVRNAIKDKLVPTSQSKVIPLTRDDIVTYGRAKQIILDATQLQALPAEDPRKNLSEMDMVARAAADRIFELSVQIRRQRQAKLTATQADESLQETHECVDGFIYLVDYPTKRDEVLALSKYGQSLHAVFQIEQILPAVEDAEEEEEDPHDESKVSEPKAPDSEEARESALEICHAFRSARADSDSKSGLRNLAFLRVPFINQAVTYSSTEADGTAVKKQRPSEDNFVAEFFAKALDKYGQYFVQFQKFKKIVTVNPLAPDRHSLRRIEELNREKKTQEQMLQEASGDLEQSIKDHENSKAHDDLQPDEAAQAEKEMDEQRQKFNQLKSKTQARAEEINKELKELMQKCKRSLDDDVPAKPFDLNVYRNDFVQNPETSNNISSVLSAMISHIEDVNGGQTGRPVLSDEPSTNDESNIDHLFEKFESDIECDLSLRDRGPDLVADAPMPSSLTSRGDLGIQIHDQTNRTLEVKQTVPAGMLEREEERLTKIAEREQEIFRHLRVPGKNRDAMPSIPDRSQRKRDSENPQFYPFCTLPVDEAERMLQLRHFQQLIKSNFIDKGKIGINKHTKDMVFERNFENHMNMDIFSQTFADSLLDDPEISTMYYPRTDGLLVALYNKHKQPNRHRLNNLKFKSVDQLELPLNTDDADGEKNWRASYRVLPDFENWLAFFADEIIQEQELPKPPKPDSAAVADAQAAPAKGAKDKNPAPDAPDPNAIPVNLMKYVLDEEVLPSALINVEDAKVQCINEKSALMYPDDNSVIRVDHFSVGGTQFSKSLVMKDKLKFGLRSRKAQVTEPHKDYGLVRSVAVGDTEFFLHFENGTKLGLEQVQIERNPQMTIQVQPPPPTPEEVAYKLEQQKKYAEALAKTQKANKPPPTDIEIPKTPQPTWETAPPNFLDGLYTDEYLANSSSTATLTFKNGLIVQYLGNGHVLQMHETAINQEGLAANVEINRACTKEGIVIRQFANLDIEMLFPDGVHSCFSRKRLEWTITNNKGMKRSYKNGVFTDLPPIPCAVETEAVSGARMMIREDEIVSVTYQDGSIYCQHRDGTKFHTSSDGSEIRVEKRSFASHIIRLGGSIGQEYEGPFKRALDDVVLETYLPDGTLSQTFKDIVCDKADHTEKKCFRTMINRSDLSVVITDTLGNVSVITSNTRDSLNELGEKKRIGQDVDYLQELSRKEGHFTPQVYQAWISHKQGESLIQTKNSFNDTVFVLRYDMTIDKIVDGVVLKTKHIKDQEKNVTKRKLAKAMSHATNVVDTEGQRRHMEFEVEETGQFVEPHGRSFNYPRFFLINNDGNAKELLSRHQLAYDMRQKGLKPELTIRQMMSDVFNNQIVENTYTLTKVINMEQVQLQQQSLNDVELPDNAKVVLQDKLESPDINLLIPVQQQLLFSQIFKMPDCDSFNQQAFANDFQRYTDWRINNVRYETEFGIVHLPPSKDVKVDWEKIEDEESFNKRVGIKILKQRATPREKFNPEEFRAVAMRDINSNASVKTFRETNLVSLNNSQQSIQHIKSHQVIANSEAPLKRKLTKKQRAEAAAQSRAKVDKKLAHLHQMKIASDFICDYFESEKGREFLNLHPPQPPSEEVLLRMQQRLERQQRGNNNSAQGNDQAFDGGDQQPKNQGDDEARDNPIVALEPDELKQGSHFTGSKKDRSIIQGDKSKLSSAEIAALPSLYMQEKLYLFEKEQETQLKAEEHHIVKTKDFNVYGRLREEKTYVKVLEKPTAPSDLNEKFITTECITDRRVKTSSQAPRYYINAPSVEQVRKQGQHQMILGAIEKKQTFGELINQSNSMVTGVLHDSLKRSLRVMPGSVVFGALRPGSINELTVSIKNEDQLAHRITIKPMSDRHVVVKQEEYGIIAPGMIKQLTVTVRVAEDEKPFEIKDTIIIMSKHDIFKVPVTAEIVSAADFEILNEERMAKTGKSIQSSRVRERLMTKIQKASANNGPVKLTSLPPREENKSELEDL